MTIGYQLVQTITTHLDIPRDEARERAARLLAEVGIPAPRERLDSYPHELSGGMRQRIVLALAFCCEPRVVIADEPTTALDVSVQAQVIDLLKRMCRERGTAVMLVTHDMGVIAEAADRVAVMYAGRVVETGSTMDVLRAPLHPYSRGLMASIPSMRRAARDRARADLPMIPGAMPRLDALPRGCAFHPRCPVAIARCARERPPFVPAGSSGGACWLVADGASGEVPAHA
jgi:peptide/nickel transport system ATP-binding protein